MLSLPKDIRKIILHKLDTRDYISLLTSCKFWYCKDDLVYEEKKSQYLDELERQNFKHDYKNTLTNVVNSFDEKGEFPEFAEIPIINMLLNTNKELYTNVFKKVLSSPDDLDKIINLLRPLVKSEESFNPLGEEVLNMAKANSNFFAKLSEN